MADPVPPGRAGRLWLRGRLASAQRSLRLLDRKRELLRRELAGLGEKRDQTRQQWVASCSEAERWGLRAVALGGASDLSLAAMSLTGQAKVELPWRNTMGVRHPGNPVCSLPHLPPLEAAASSAAVAPAADAYRQAIQAAVVYAAADRSFRVLEADLKATERRRRAIQRRRLPALQDTLDRLELRLDELEREERVVGRWARGVESPLDPSS